MTEPSSGHISVYKTNKAPVPEDGRLFSPVFERNSPPMIAALAPIFAGLTGTVVEIGSGTGQHAGAFQLAFPELVWQPSDLMAHHRASIEGWRSHLRLPPRPAWDLDAATDWAALPEVAALDDLQAVVAMNVIHIAPVSVLHGIIDGAGKSLSAGGLLILYGPFREDGAFNSEGDKKFDATLRAENPEWGLRDLKDVRDLAAKARFELAQRIEMPANNRILVFSRL